jgi:predicted small lipoprotein YifL
MFSIVSLILSSVTLRGQKSPEYLPPLPSTTSPDNSTLSSELRLLLPAEELTCWSHGASENPQNSHDNSDQSSALEASILSMPDPLLVLTSTAFQETEAVPRVGIDQSVWWAGEDTRPGLEFNAKQKRDEHLEPRHDRPFSPRKEIRGDIFVSNQE